MVQLIYGEEVIWLVVETLWLERGDHWLSKVWDSLLEGSVSELDG